jgi:hypothetical protein
MAIKDDYLARAAAAFAEADTPGLLQNVKDRCLRSAAAWTQMAEAAQKTETLRAGREAQSAAGKSSAAMQERDLSALEACNG